jgi:hypothetical protein
MKKVHTGSGQGLALSLGVLAFGVALSANAQAPASGRAQVIASSGGLLSDGSSLLGLAGGQLYREIDDPHTGDRWLLTRNEQYPGGPGRLVRVAVSGSKADSPSAPGGGPGQIAGQAAPALPVIRTGDRVIVEEHTAVVDAVLEARALMPVAVGAAFNARLMIGGRVVRVVALGPGRAALEPGMGARP